MDKRNIGFLFVLLILAAVIAGGYFFLRYGERKSGSAVYNLISRQLPTAELVTRTVVWQSVISEKQNFPARYYVIGRTATIKAGFDLKKMDPAKDITVNSETKTVTLKLPRAEILSLSWSPNRIIMERHSIAIAVTRKSAEEENRRLKLFEDALRRDAQLYQLLDLTTLKEGIVRYLNPLIEQSGWKLVVQSEEHVDFPSALDAYIAEHP